MADPTKETDESLLDEVRNKQGELRLKKKYKELSLEDRLINAIMLGHEKVISNLLESGANPNAIHPKGFTMIEFAKALDRGPVVELLKSYGAKAKDVDTPPKKQPGRF